ncbi:MAG: hypothetical protein Q4E43_09125, partial [Akkermansia sp.]|nr:hypothetical protein [Akkermansia sp.]
PTTFVATNHCIPTTPCKKTIGTHVTVKPILCKFAMPWQIFCHSVANLHKKAARGGGAKKPLRPGMTAGA